MTSQTPAKRIVGSSNGVSYPRHTALRGLLPSTQEEILRDAGERLRLLLVPLMLLHRARCARRKLALERFGTKEMPLASQTQFAHKLKELELFEEWPVESLQKLLGMATRASFEPGSVLCYEGTPHRGSNVLIVVNGQVQVSRAGDSLGPQSAVSVLGILTAVDGTSCNVTAVAVTHVDVLFIRPDAFRSFMASAVVPLAAAEAVKASARAERLDLFAVTNNEFGGTTELKRSLLFSSCRRSELAALARNFTPYCPPDGTIVFREGEFVNALYYIDYGELKPTETAPSHPSVEGQGTAVHQSLPSYAAPSPVYYGSSTRCGSFVGEFHCFFGLRWPGPDLVARGAVRCWMLSKRQLHKLKTADAELAKSISSSLRTQRALQLSGDREVFGLARSMLERTPFFGQLLRSVTIPPLNELALDQVAGLLEPKTYAPQEVLVSRSQPCERLIFLLSGRGKIMLEQATVEVGPGTPLGFPLALPHSWAHSLIATTPLETLELDRKTFLHWLHKACPATVPLFQRYCSILLRPNRHTAAEAMELSLLLGDTEPATAMYSLDIPVSRAAVNDRGSNRRKLLASSSIKLVSELFTAGQKLAATKPLSAAVQAGETTIFYTSPRRSGIRAHTNVFKSILSEKQHRDALEEAERTSGGGGSPVSSTHSPVSNRSTTSPMSNRFGATSNSRTPRRPGPPASAGKSFRRSDSFSATTPKGTSKVVRLNFQSSDSDRSSQVGLAGKVPVAGKLLQSQQQPRARDDRRLGFVDVEDEPHDAYSLEKRVDGIFSHHRQRVDGLWIHSNNEVKNAVTRMYPPVKRNFSFSRQSSMTGTGGSRSSFSVRGSSRSSTPRSDTTGTGSLAFQLHDDGFLEDAPPSIRLPKAPER